MKKKEGFQMDMNAFLWMVFGLSIIPSMKFVLGLYDDRK